MTSSNLSTCIVSVSVCVCVQVIMSWERSIVTLGAGQTQQKDTEVLNESQVSTGASNTQME